jgi:hypothetical protein
MTDYSNWKIKQSDLKQKQEEYTEVAQWCNDSGQYHIEPVDEYYAVVANPEPTPPTYDEVKEQRAEYRRKNIDDKTAERSRKMANGTWTEEDEQDYLALDAEVTAYIEEHFPYPAE